MARTDNDTWDLGSSVGATATMVAASRAVASESPNPIIDDPFAEPLVRAVGIDFFIKMVDGDITPADLDGEDADPTAMSMERMTDAMAVRTRFFDEFFLDAAEAGIRQAVILASGLDSRAYRLPWPTGTTVFEIDQPQVIEFKTATLAELGAAPTAERRAVGIDLRFDWPAALRDAGFESSQPTAWIAEGLLGYLPPEAQDTLIDTITELSASGSRFGCESVPNVGAMDSDEVRDRMQAVADRWREHGFELDFADLVYLGDRADAAVYLAGHGWTTTGSTSAELLAENGLTPLTDDLLGMGDVLYVSATLK